MTKVSQAVKQASKLVKKHSNISPKVKELQKGKKQKRFVPISLTANFPLLITLDSTIEPEVLMNGLQNVFNYKKIKYFAVGFDLKLGEWIYCFYVVKNKPTKKEINVLLSEKNYQIWNEDDEDDYDEDDIYPIEKDTEYDEDEEDLDEY